jgi:hypothetical protein
VGSNPSWLTRRSPLVATLADPDDNYFQLVSPM